MDYSNLVTQAFLIIFILLYFLQTKEISRLHKLLQQEFLAHPDAELDEELRQALQKKQGRIEAIRLLRSRKGIGLLMAQQHVDNLAAQKIEREEKNDGTGL